MSEDRCICCGEIVPEGRMVCPGCEKKAEKERDLAEELVSKWARGELVERKKGKWIDKGEYCMCPFCRHTEPPQYDGVQPIPNFTPYCSMCGADMREEKTDD